MKIYVSLPITGYNLSERKKYAARVKKKLQSVYPDSKIITPFDVCPDSSFPYEVLIGNDIAAMLSCDAVYVCKDSSHSKGCRLECYAAIIYGKLIMKKEDFDIKVEP